jgi:hypothetical protein
MTHVGSQMLALVTTMYKTIRYYKNGGLFGAQPLAASTRNKSPTLVARRTIHSYNNEGSQVRHKTF